MTGINYEESAWETLCEEAGEISQARIDMLKSVAKNTPSGVDRYDAIAFYLNCYTCDVRTVIAELKGLNPELIEGAYSQLQETCYKSGKAVPTEVFKLVLEA